MKIYTKNGDKGKTTLMHQKNISKSDDRIELLGTVDELSSHLGLAKAAAVCPVLTERLSTIQRQLIHLMAGIADPYQKKYQVPEEQIEELEREIDRLEDSFPRPKEFVLYGGCELSARLDLARTVARRAERRMDKVAQRYGADPAAQRYLNRLSDYLYVAARYVDHNGEQIDRKLIRTIVESVLEQTDRG